MRLILLAASLVAAGSAAQAQIPFFNAVCGNRAEVHADEGGPIYINGTEAELTTSSDSYYEAKYNNMTLSVSINPDGSPSLSYTGKGGANGVCNLTDGGGGGGECPVDVSEADRANYPACN